MAHTDRFEMTHSLPESVMTNLCVHYHVMFGLGFGESLKDALVILK